MTCRHARTRASNNVNGRRHRILHRRDLDGRASYTRLGSERIVRLNPRLGGIDHVGHVPRSGGWVLVLVVLAGILAALWNLPAHAHGDRMIQVTHDSDTDLYRRPTVLTGLTTTFLIDEPTYLEARGHLSVHHRNLIPESCAGCDYSTMVSAGMSAWLLGPYDTEAELGEEPCARPAYECPHLEGYRFVRGSSAGKNVVARQHYETLTLHAFANLTDSGWYRLVWAGTSLSSAAPDTDGLAEVLIEGGQGVNGLTVRLTAREGEE